MALGQSVEGRPALVEALGQCVERRPALVEALGQVVGCWVVLSDGDAGDP